MVTLRPSSNIKSTNITALLDMCYT